MGNSSKRKFSLLKLITKLPSWSVRFFFYLIAISLFKIRVNGKENLPKQGGALLVSNHVTLIDALFIIASVPRMVRFVMIKKVYDKPMLHWFFKLMNMIPIEVGNSKNALEEFNQRCQDEINAGNVVCIFAEGQLSRNGHLQGFKKGIEHISKGITAPIIPLHMEGLHQVPLATNPVTQRMNPFSFRHLFKKVFVSIGESLPSTTTSFVVRKRIKELEMGNISLRLGHLKVQNQQEHIIQRNYHTLKSLFPISDEYVFVSDLTNESVIDQMIKRYFTKSNGNEIVLCSTVKQVETRIQTQDFPKKMSYLFLVDGLMDDKTKLLDQFPDLVIYEGWADFKGFPIIALNTNNWEGRGLDGKVIVQEGKKEQSLGRVLHGVAIKLIKEGNEVSAANETGTLFLKYLPEMDWVNTRKTGALDEAGFLYLENTKVKLSAEAV